MGAPPKVVAILSVHEFAKVLPLLEQPSLHALLSQSPLNRLEFEPLSTSPMHIRDIDL